MKYLAAYTLLVLAGNKTPSANDITNLLKEVGVEVDAGEVTKVVDALKGKDLEQVIAEGSKKVQNLSFGGGSGGSAPAQGAAKAAEAPAAKAPAKEEKKPEPVEEDVDMGGLFDF